jgi:hypothetical protein
MRGLHRWLGLAHPQTCAQGAAIEFIDQRSLVQAHGWQRSVLFL